MGGPLCFKFLSDEGQEYRCSRVLIEKVSDDVETKIAGSRNHLLAHEKEGVFPFASPGRESSLPAHKPERYLQVMPEFSAGSLASSVPTREQQRSHISRVSCRKEGQKRACRDIFQGRCYQLLAVALVKPSVLVGGSQPPRDARLQQQNNH